MHAFFMEFDVLIGFFECIKFVEIVLRCPSIPVAQ